MQPPAHAGRRGDECLCLAARVFFFFFFCLRFGGGLHQPLRSPRHPPRPFSSVHPPPPSKKNTQPPPPSNLNQSTMAKSKNHTAHNQTYKAHRNGIKKLNQHKHNSRKGMDPKFLRNQRYAQRHNVKAGGAKE